MNAWIYARKSPSDTDEQVGVDAQVKLGVKEIERRDWAHAGTFTDVAKSAYEAQHRPGYEALLEAIRNGLVDAIVIRHNDRLHRDVEEYKAFTKLARKHRVQVVAVLGGDWEMQSAVGRLTGTMAAAIAEYESAIKSERVLSGALLRRAEAGLPAHTRFRPFGFEDDGITVRDSEAKLIRDGVADLIAGRMSLGAVARSWGRTTTGARKILQNRRLIGQREFQGAIYEAQWPALIDREDWEVVQAILAGKTRPAMPRRHALSGFVCCASCKTPMRVGTSGQRKATDDRPGRAGALTYRCMTDGCPRKVQRQYDRLETHVIDRVLFELECRGRHPLTARNSGAVTAEISKLEGRLTEIEAQMDEDDAPVAMLSRAYRRIEKQIEELRGQVTLTPVQSALGPERPMTKAEQKLTGKKAWHQVISPWRVWWNSPDTSLAERRALLSEEVEAVYVHPTQHGRLPLDEEAVEIRWRPAEQAA